MSYANARIRWFHFWLWCVDGPVSASEEDEEENEFYDAIAEGGGNTPSTGNDTLFTLNLPTGHHTQRRNSSDSSSETEETQETQQVCVFCSFLRYIREVPI